MEYIMKQYKFSIPRQVIAGENASGQITEIIKSEKVSKVIVFTDEGVLNSGVCEAIFTHIKRAGANYCVISNLRHEPSTHDISRAVEQIKGIAGGLIVAVGGGSVIDTAKLCAAMKNTSYEIDDLLQDNSLIQKGLPTVVIPTTCGSGSEATYNAVVAIPEKSVKVGIVNMNLLADYVLLDGNMIRRLPPEIIAATGVDALAHVLECFTSNKANPFSDLYAAEGTKLIFENLERAYNNGDDIEAKSNMMLAAFYGGVAIASSGTTAVHALSYPLGGKFHIAHGISNAILLVPVMRANLKACEDRLALLEDIVNMEGYRRTKNEKANSMIERIERMVKNIGISYNLRKFGITEENLDFLVEAGASCKRLLDNNRCDLTKNDIREIYHKVIVGGF
jgi:alcohol dehydrogenase class IV